MIRRDPTDHRRLAAQSADAASDRATSRHRRRPIDHPNPVVAPTAAAANPTRQAQAPRASRRARRCWRSMILAVAGVIRHGVLDRHHTAPRPGAGRLPRPARRPGKGTTWLLVGSDSRQGLTPEQQQELGHRRRHRQRPHRHDPAGARAARRVEQPRPRWCRSPGTPMCRSRTTASDKINAAFAIGGARAAGPDRRAGDRPAPRPLRRDRVRRVRRRGRRASAG